MTMMQDVDKFLDKFQASSYDIRVTHDARYVDQKCTPDIVCFIADCILSTSCANKHFTVNDLWDEKYFSDNCRVIFGKPSPASDFYYPSHYAFNQMCLILRKNGNQQRLDEITRKISAEGWGSGSNKQ